MKYITKPAIIDADEWDGSEEMAIELNLVRKMNVFGVVYGVDTLEGFMEASPGDFIVTGTEGERYPCKPDAFHNKYEEYPK